MVVLSRVMYAVVPLVAALAGCGSGSGGPGGQVATADGVVRCSEVPPIRADEAAYRDSPVYGNAHDLVEEVQAWAAGRPEFVELWLDRERGGWITIGVKGADAAAVQDQVATRWPGEGIVVVEVPWTVEELDALATEVQEALTDAGVQSAGWGMQVNHGVAWLDLGVITPEAVNVLSRFADRPICVDGVAVDAAPEDRPQAIAGEGWRLLGDSLTGEAFRTGVATTDAQLTRLWDSAGLNGDPPEVDWESEIVVWFGAVYGSGCPVRMDGVIVAGALMYADLAVPGAVYGCNADGNPHAFVVAVARDLLPRGPFQVQLEARDPYPGSPDERTVVDVDLSVPRSVANDEQLHTDPELLAGNEPPLVKPGGALPDGPVRFAYRGDPSCGIPVLGPLGGSVWRLADGEAAWEIAEGEELNLYPLDGYARELIASSQEGDWVFVRLADATTCP